MGVKGIYVRVKELNDRIRNFGLIIAVLEGLYYRFSLLDFFHVRSAFFRYKHKTIEAYLSKQMREIIEEYQKITVVEENVIKDDSPIWVCWWQGEANMPELVKACFGSICRNAGGHPVILVTKDNYSEYATLPSYIVDKFLKGKFSITHFSDLLRISLLYEHGGLWIDSTIWVSQPISSIVGRTFYTVKKDTCYDFLSTPLWTSFLYGGGKHNILFAFMREMMWNYLKINNSFMDYFLMDYTFLIAYHNLPMVKKQIDGLPLTNFGLYDLCNSLNTPFYMNSYHKICANSPFHKLTWKASFQKELSNGGQTFYGWLVDSKNFFLRKD